MIGTLARLASTAYQAAIASPNSLTLMTFTTRAPGEKCSRKGTLRKRAQHDRIVDFTWALALHCVAQLSRGSITSVLLGCIENSHTFDMNRKTMNRNIAFRTVIVVTRSFAKGAVNGSNGWQG
jgi:hypothetical protein